MPDPTDSVNQNIKYFVVKCVLVLLCSKCFFPFYLFNSQIYPAGKGKDPNPSKDKEPIFGKQGARYFKHGAFCLETQNYPDAINHVNFPNAILNPGERYSHEVQYRFSVNADPIVEMVPLKN